MAFLDIAISGYFSGPDRRYYLNAGAFNAYWANIEYGNHRPASSDLVFLTIRAESGFPGGKGVVNGWAISQILAPQCMHLPTLVVEEVLDTSNKEEPVVEICGPRNHEVAQEASATYALVLGKKPNGCQRRTAES